MSVNLKPRNLPACTLSRGAPRCRRGRYPQGQPQDVTLIELAAAAGWPVCSPPIGSAQRRSRCARRTSRLPKAFARWSSTPGSRTRALASWASPIETDLRCGGRIAWRFTELGAALLHRRDSRAPADGPPHRRLARSGQNLRDDGWFDAAHAIMTTTPSPRRYRDRSKSAVRRSR